MSWTLVLIACGRDCRLVLVSYDQIAMKEYLVDKFSSQ